MAKATPFACHQRRAVLQRGIGLVIQVKGWLGQDLALDKDILRDVQAGEGPIVLKGGKMLRL